MRPPHLRVRTLMIAVAVAAVAIGGWQMRGRRNHRLKLAMLCGFAVRESLKNQGGIFQLDTESVSLHHRPLAPMTGDAEDRRRRSAYWLALRHEYERAAHAPWLPVPPDPPPE